MRNWLGQEIEVGSVVYRGARDGNTSTYKVGTVIKVNEDKRTARVKWHMEPNPRWRVDEGQPEYTPIRYYGHEGTSSIDTMVLIDIDLSHYPEWDRKDFPV